MGMLSHSYEITGIFKKTKTYTASLSNEWFSWRIWDIRNISKSQIPFKQLNLILALQPISRRSMK